MSDTTIAITKREAASTRANQRLRKQDVIPGVLYGQGREPLSIQVERVTLRSAFSGEAGRNAILSLEIEGEKEPVNAVLKAMEIDRVRDRVTHIDLMAISMTEKFTAPVPVHLIGDPDGVKLDGGKLLRYGGNYSKFEDNHGRCSAGQGADRDQRRHHRAAHRAFHSCPRPHG